MGLSTRSTCSLRGSRVDTAWKNGMEIFARNVASRPVRRIVSLSPRAVTPAAFGALPARTAAAPTMFVPLGSVMKSAAGDPSSASSARLIA